MKKKIFLSVLIIFWVLTLLGCNGGIITDESKVRDIIDEYFLAINDQDWNRAKSYCIYDSDVYYETCDLEEYIDSLYPSVVTIDCQMGIYNIIITGNYASAYIDGTLTIITDDHPITDDSSGYFYLQKINNNWKIYDS